MPKLNLKEVDILQMDGKYKKIDLRDDICKPFWLHHDESMSRLGMKMYQGECELTGDEVAEVRKAIAQEPWVVREAIEKQLAG